jgi:hypothetical protein
MGAANAGIGRQRDGACDGLEAGVEDVGSAHVVGPDEPCQGRAAREVHGLEGGPAAEAVATERRIVLRKPWQNLGTVVFEGPGSALGAPALGTDQAAVCDEVREGPPGRAWGLQGRELVRVCQEEFDRACRIGGIVCGSAGSKRCAVRGHGERSNGKEHEAILLAPCRHEGPFRACQTDSARVSVAARAQGLAPRVDGCRAVCEAQERTPCSTSGLSADIVFGIGPREADKSSQFFWCSTFHV